MSFLVDTNILAEVARPCPNSGVLAWADSVTHIFLSVISLEEIAYGLAWRPNKRIEAWLGRFIDEHTTTLPVDQQIAIRAGRLRGELQRSGKTHTQADMLIAATALTRDMTLATRNERDFEACEVRILNPFQ